MLAVLVQPGIKRNSSYIVTEVFIKNQGQVGRSFFPNALNGLLIYSAVTINTSFLALALKTVVDSNILMSYSLLNISTCGVTVNHILFF